MLSCADEPEVTEEVWSLYMGSFTDPERIPRGNLDRALSAGGFLHVFRNKGDFIGFAYGFSNSGIAFLVYLATVPEVRGRGYGKEMLALLRSMHPDERIFLVTEMCNESADDFGMRVRRQDYYLRNGCSRTGCTVITDGVEMDTMAVQGELSADEMAGAVRFYEDVHNGRLRALGQGSSPSSDVRVNVPVNLDRCGERSHL